ncbi:Tat (twin-arginine translocation) pathway signal sequence [Amycolatopsis marina]|uniref:Tat (Twin-arginine translocation) pathway signal sequence n=1 Tax=Amycolatopsis marina TaxID=490629 RepID=A0A1I1ASN6_9PSEU|nr:metallophosphoesterase [Amycolatopsis marina]SFB41075.1 Tat (twin-arginine translocation) pathway signal sequence [Amycolatopsis marina]
MKDSRNSAVDRRSVIKAGGAGALAMTVGSVVPPVAHADEALAATPLRFNRDGTFKIVQFNDTQDDHRIDRRTIELMNHVLDDERPDLVVLVGDNITGGPKTELEARQALNNVIQPMEQRGIPWAATFGNHDEDSTGSTGFDEADMLRFFRTYPNNLNTAGPKDVTGTGNMNLLINGSHGGKPVFNVWLLDSGRYAPKQIAGQDFAGYPTWDWLRADQIRWYLETSEKLERRSGAPIPSLMFLHICLWEHRFMWFASVDSRTDGDHARAVEKHSIVGERNEDECPGPFNSGMFSAIQHRGDVRGVFCGHDHVNTYMGNYYGVLLGYGPGTGFGAYGLGGEENHRLRGARVFTLDESVDGVLAETHNVFAKDYGIDMSNTDQSMDPLPLPRRRSSARSASE